MVKLATITPINCITKEQDDDIFVIYWNGEDQELVACFEDGRQELLEQRAETLTDAVEIVYALYAPSNAFIYEAEEVEM